MGADRDVAGEAAATRPARVLLVEDEATLRIALTRTLEAAGARVIAAGSVAEALALLEGEALPTLVLSDLNLGLRLGTEVLERARALGIPRRALASGDRDALRAVDPELATDVLLKPVSRAAVLALIGATPKSATALRSPRLDATPANPRARSSREDGE